MPAGRVATMFIASWFGRALAPRPRTASASRAGRRPVSCASEATIWTRPSSNRRMDQCRAPDPNLPRMEFAVSCIQTPERTSAAIARYCDSIQRERSGCVMIGTRPAERSSKRYSPKRGGSTPCGGSKQKVAGGAEAEYRSAFQTLQQIWSRDARLRRPRGRAGFCFIKRCLKFCDGRSNLRAGIVVDAG